MVENRVKNGEIRSQISDLNSLRTGGRTWSLKWIRREGTAVRGGSEARVAAVLRFDDCGSEVAARWLRLACCG